MKLNVKQLRKLIVGEAKRLRESFDEQSIASEYADYIAGAIEQLLRADDVVNDAVEMMMGAVGDENIRRPVRYEDVSDIADEIVKIVFADDELKNTVRNAAISMLNSMMEPA